MTILRIIAVMIVAASLAACDNPDAAAVFGIDLDCSDFSEPQWVGDNGDPHNLDGDGDGWGCEHLA